MATLLAATSHLLVMHYLVLAKTEDGGPGLFIVDKANLGLSVTHFGSISGERVSDVNLVNVEVPAESRLAESVTWDAVEELLDIERLILCASGLGGAKSSLDMMVEYAKQRVIFGHPIGDYQSIQHNIADMALDIESAGALIYSAAWMSSNDIPCIKERAFAQLYCKKVFTRIAEQVTHCHGTVALCKDHNMTLYFRKAKATQLSLNHADSYCAVITRGMGL